MIKQIRIENLYNYQAESILDFTVTETDDTLIAQSFKHDKIANFMIMYGKNNIGKSNFIKIIRDFKDFLLQGEYHFEAFKPKVKDISSFEIITENEAGEMAYHIQFQSDPFLLIMESFKVNDQEYAKDSPYFISFLKEIGHITIMSHSQVTEEAKILQLFATLKPEQEALSFIESLMSVCDLNVAELVFDRDKLYFLHQSGQRYSYEDLSSGTKQIFNIGLHLFANIKEDRILFFDELEVSLHPEVLDAMMQFLATLTRVFTKTQVFIATHQAMLLDYDFIPNETKVFLKQEQGSLEIDYLSNYEIDEDQVLSKRYLLNAFASNPSPDLSFKSFIIGLKEKLDHENH